MAGEAPAPCYTQLPCLWALWREATCNYTRSVLHSRLTCLAAKPGLLHSPHGPQSEQAIMRVLEHRPEVVLMDVRLPDDDGFATLELIRRQSPLTGAVIFSAYDNPAYVARAAALGAHDYVLKGAPRREIIAAVARAAAFQRPPSDSLLGRVRATLEAAGGGDAGPLLSNHEVQMLRYAALGFSDREIGRLLGIGRERAKESMQNLFTKLQARTRAEAAVWAVHEGIE